MEGERQFSRNTEKKKSLRKSLTVNPSIYKAKESILGDSFNADNFGTNMERMIETLNLIKKKLHLYQDIELVNKVDWMTDTLLKGQLNDIIIKIESDKINKDELEKIFEILAEFSSEFNFQRSMENIQTAILQKKSSMGGKTGLPIITLDDGIYTGINDIFNIRDEIFDKNFNIWNMIQEEGRENIMPIICGNIFHKYNLLNKIEKTTFINFIEEIRIGYVQTNPYHNV